VKKTSVLFLAGISATGLLSGYAARCLSTAHSASASHAAAASAGSGKSAADTPDSSAAGKAKSAQQAIPHVRATETVESLLAPDDGSLYRRLANWMIDASEQDIAAYWAGYRTGKRSNDLTDLVFLNWTRLNPQAAIAAVAGSDDEHYAWWAWACHDPQNALAAAIAANPDRVNNVAWGIGEFHPEWLRQHFKEIPESARKGAIAGMQKWGDDENPLASLDFMRENHMGFDEGIFKALAQKDPWAAFDWIKANPGRSNDPFAEGGTDDGRMYLLLTTISNDRPEDLKRLAEQTPPGELKRKMEDALFDNLLTTDPAAAIEQAGKTDVPLIAAERYSKIGLSLVSTDPEQAFEMAQKMFATNSGRLGYLNSIEYGSGSSNSESLVSDTYNLISALVAKDPARMLEIAIHEDKEPPETSQTFSHISMIWMEQDLADFADWVNQQTDPTIREPATDQIISKLSREGQYPEAVEWAVRSEPIETNSKLPTLLSQWQKSDPAAATRWMESVNLPETQKAELRKLFDQQKPSAP
jgi:hypothetical protein